MMTAPGFRWSFVLSLAVAQLVSWGSLYYSFAVLSLPMAGEMGWSRAEVSGALSAGLAATGWRQSSVDGSSTAMAGAH